MRAPSVCLPALVLSVLSAPVHADEKKNTAAPAKADQKAPKKDEKPEPSVFDLSGFYTVWGLNQHGFLLGADQPLNDADYVVQLLRLRMKLGTPQYGVVAQVDAAQGWWGVDNNPNIGETAEVDDEGNPATGTSYNPYKLFRNKDTNYVIHLDRAWGYLQIPWIPFELEVRAGRQWYGVGNKLVLDFDYDGVIVAARPFEGFEGRFLWGRVSEGRDSVRAPGGVLMTDKGQYRDADLFGLQLIADLQAAYALPIRAELFALRFEDRTNQPDWSFLPQGHGYLRSRFTPNISNALAFGLALSGKLALLQGLSYAFEVDYLRGNDNVDNADFAGNLLDRNNSDIEGYNVFLKLTQAFLAGLPMDAGLSFGLGSGDSDPRSGKGNINKIQTMGFFSMTNVWEDSVMPDLQGISPQGLGSPVSRGYRELENTTMLQLRVGAVPWAPLRIEASYTWLRATEAIRAWDASGPLAPSSNDIGSELDANLILKLYGDRVVYKALFGYFFTGDGAAYLIKGSAADASDAWELKNVVLVKF